MTTKDPRAAGSKPASATEAARQTQDETRRAAQSLAEDAKSTARAAAEHASSEAAHQAQRAKSGVADEVNDVASALRRAADEARDGSPQARAFGYVAESLADVADTINHKDFGEMAEDLSSLARRNPVAFLGGAALLGFAMTRFAKASRPAAGAHGNGHASAHTVPAQPMSPASGATPAPGGRTTAPSTPATRTGGGTV